MVAGTIGPKVAPMEGMEGMVDMKATESMEVTKTITEPREVPAVDMDTDRDTQATSLATETREEYGKVSVAENIQLRVADKHRTHSMD